MPRLACLLLLAPPALAQIHVDDDATGANDGSSWHDAFVDLQTALAVAGSGDAIWVATGTYRPSQTLDRTTSFVIPLGVDVYGGFDGTETALDRRAGLYEHTVLTGDLAGDDAPGFVGRDENSLHVVIGSYGMLLDGFTIRGGNANAGNDWEQRGGGMRAEFPYEGEVRNCTFVENEAMVGGGGVYVWLALDTYIDCTFVRNRTAGTGGGIWSDNSQTAYAWMEGCRRGREPALRSRPHAAARRRDHRRRELGVPSPVPRSRRGRRGIPALRRGALHVPAVSPSAAAGGGSCSAP